MGKQGEVISHTCTCGSGPKKTAFKVSMMDGLLDDGFKSLGQENRMRNSKLWYQSPDILKGDQNPAGRYRTEI